MELCTAGDVLRRLREAAPDLTTCRCHGGDPEIWREAAEAEGFRMSETPDAEVFFQPDGEFHMPPACAASCVVVVAKNAPANIREHTLSVRARRYVTLREWVRGCFGSDSPLGRRVADGLVSSAVGDRPTSVEWPGNRLWIYHREPLRRAASSLERVKFLLVTGGGTGLFPIMPATVTSLAMLPLSYLLLAWGGMSAVTMVSAIVAVLATVGSVALEKWAGRRFLAADPREFTLDEVAGLSVAWALLPFAAPWWTILVAFGLFRVFDIFKWGVHWAEQLPIPGKIVWDDLVAGLYAGLLTLLILRFF